MKIRSIQIWLIFCVIIEILIYSISEQYGYSALKIELIKSILYFIIYLISNIIMKIKKWEKDTILRMNGGMSLALSSLSGAIFAIFFGRIALDDAMVTVEWIGLLLLIWLFAFSGMLFFIRCRYDYNKMSQSQCSRQ